MFGRGNHPEQEVTAEAVVLDNDMAQEVLHVHSRESGKAWLQRLRLRVTYPDGSVAECESTVRGYGVPFVVGETVPVKYHAGEPAAVQVDIGAIKTRHQGEATQGQEWNRDLADLDRRRAAGEISDEQWSAEAERMLFEE